VAGADSRDAVLKALCTAQPRGWGVHGSTHEAGEGSRRGDLSAQSLLLPRFPSFFVACRGYRTQQVIPHRVKIRTRRRTWWSTDRRGTDSRVLSARDAECLERQWPKIWSGRSS